MIPTVGFNMRKVTKGNVTIKVMRINFQYQTHIGKFFFCILALGHRRSTEVSWNVGKILSRCNCYSVSND